MNKPPRLPLDILRYWEKTRGLSAAEHGVYLNLIMLGFRSRNALIPNDEKDLRTFFKSQMDMHGRGFNLIVMPILHRFFKLVDERGNPVDNAVGNHGKKTFWKQETLSEVFETVSKVLQSKIENPTKRDGEFNENKDINKTTARIQSNPIKSMDKSMEDGGPQGIFKNDVFGLDGRLSEATLQEAKRRAPRHDLSVIIKAYKKFEIKNPARKNIQKHFLSFLETHITKNPV